MSKWVERANGDSAAKRATLSSLFLKVPGLKDRETNKYKNA